MKWNNRLKSVLTKPEENVFSGECLETQLRITAETPESLVSAVIRSDELRHFPENLTNSSEAEKQTKLVSAVIRSGQFRHSFKNNDELAQFEADTFHKILNGFIADGITFDVSADDFQTIDGARILKRSDREFLKLNGAAILCQLQQSLLMKHLFNHSPERFEDFAFEITERECLNTPLRITGKTRYEIYFEAVKSTTRKWFADLLDEMSDPASTFIN
ncbi:MAG: hypothetical protein H0X72_01785 [Acidobacteria bacterium]|jgi:hypothetical protein|nr:hypothetical protein [Acidobacteriota bacterium]